MNTQFAKLVLRGLVVAGFTLVAFHFTMTILYVLPLNPVKISVGADVERYMAPYFRQRWALFAPDPPLDNKILLLRYRLEKNSLVEESEWHDLDTMVLEARRENLLSPLERFGRVNRAVLAAAMGTYDGVLDLFREQLEKRFKDQVPRDADGVDDEERRWARAAAKITEYKTEELKAMRPFLYRAGGSTCQALYPDSNVIASQYRIVRHEFPRYSDRAQADSEGPKKAIDLEWGDYDGTVSPLEI
jgi:hypothetical protein